MRSASSPGRRSRRWSRWSCGRSPSRTAICSCATVRRGTDPPVARAEVARTGVRSRLRTLAPGARAPRRGRDVISTTEERLALALEAAGLGAWTWDMASAATTWDARLEALHGMPPGSFGGTFDDWLAALHPDDRAECLRRVEEALERRSAYLLLHRTTWPDGSVHWIECRGRVVVDEAGRPT